MPVPETAVDKDSCMILRQPEIRMPGNIIYIQLSAKLSSCLSCTVCLYTASVLGVGGVIHKMQRRLAGGENRRRSFRLTVF